MAVELPDAYQSGTLSSSSHPRLSEEGHLVYPVLSRRSRGVSIGINLNPDKVCNFGCVYCQVNRTEERPFPNVSQSQVVNELKSILSHIQSNYGLWRGKPLRDIAFSGDGEPLTNPFFPEILEQVTKLRDDMGLQRIPIIIITNASRFHHRPFLNCLEGFFKNNGRIWAKLDVGSEADYQRLMRSKIPFKRVLDNIVLVGSKYPLILQSCFMRENLQEFSEDLFKDYIETVKGLLARKTDIKKIQAYTLARPPAETFVSAWGDAEMSAIGKLLKHHLDLPVETYTSFGV